MREREGRGGITFARPHVRAKVICKGAREIDLRWGLAVSRSRRDGCSGARLDSDGKTRMKIRIDRLGWRSYDGETRMERLGWRDSDRETRMKRLEWVPARIDGRRIGRSDAERERERERERE